jgi:hypothetical protein
VLASVAGELAVVAVNHRQAGAGVAREVERGDAGTKREGREGMPEILDPPKRRYPCGFLGWAPLERAELVDVEVTAGFAGKQKRRAAPVPGSVERLERPSLQCHSSA